MHVRTIILNNGPIIHSTAYLSETDRARAASEVRKALSEVLVHIKQSGRARDVSLILQSYECCRCSIFQSYSDIYIPTAIFLPSKEVLCHRLLRGHTSIVQLSRRLKHPIPSPWPNELTA